MASQWVCRNSHISFAALAETGYKALRILGLEKKEQLSKHDLVIFLYAVGLVGGGLQPVVHLLATLQVPSAQPRLLLSATMNAEPNGRRH
jgi:hypothetical protein